MLHSQRGGHPASNPAVSSSPPAKSGRSKLSEVVCFYCRKPRHIIAHCPVLGKKQTSIKPIAFLKTVKPLSPVLENSAIFPKDQDADFDGFAPFVTDGFVSLPSDPQTQIPVKILRDTASKQSIILESVLQFSERSAVGSSTLGKGFGKGFVNFPLHNILLKSDLVSGNVAVGVCHNFPVKGVSLILGNDLAGRVLVTPEVVLMPVVSDAPDELSKKKSRGVSCLCRHTGHVQG